MNGKVPLVIEEDVTGGKLYLGTMVYLGPIKIFAQIVKDGPSGVPFLTKRKKELQAELTDGTYTRCCGGTHLKRSNVEGIFGGRVEK